MGALRWRWSFGEAGGGADRDRLGEGDRPDSAGSDFQGSQDPWDERLGAGRGRGVEARDECRVLGRSGDSAHDHDARCVPHGGQGAGPQGRAGGPDLHGHSQEQKHCQEDQALGPAWVLRGLHDRRQDEAGGRQRRIARQRDAKHQVGSERHDCTHCSRRCLHRRKPAPLQGPAPPHPLGRSPGCPSCRHDSEARRCAPLSGGGLSRDRIGRPCRSFARHEIGVKLRLLPL
mmetsp:Transcript_5366/g.13640  ORF Transcript_5366/g.13640 Transcript_5366/m.13640 type:complete len:231 (-) Transcript_5366:110-802(-)